MPLLDSFGDGFDRGTFLGVTSIPISYSRVENKILDSFRSP